MRFLLFFGLLTIFLPALSAQKFLQIEKTNSLKVRKFYIGEELTFQVKEFPDDWRTEVLENILVEEGILLFPKGMVKIDDITAIRTFDRKGLANRGSLMLYTFGTGWVLFSLADALLGGTLTWSVAIVSGTAIVVGFIIKQIFKQKTHRMGKRKRLRLLDLTVEAPVLGP